RVIHHRDRQVVVGALLDAQVEAPRGHDCFCLSNSATRSLSSWFCACNLRMITRYCAFSHSALLSGSRSISTAISLTSSCWAVSSCSTSVLRWGRGVDVAADDLDVGRQLVAGDCDGAAELQAHLAAGESGRARHDLHVDVALSRRHGEEGQRRDVGWDLGGLLVPLDVQLDRVASAVGAARDRGAAVDRTDLLV